MNKLYQALVFLILGTNFSFLSAQNVGIGTPTPDPSAKLHIVDANRGLLIPKVTLSNVNIAAPVTAPARGLLVWNINPTVVGGAGEGFYYWNGAEWQTLGGANTLDMAYDEGGAGAGRIITADAGTVEINGTGGLSVDANTTTASNAGYFDNTDGSENAFVELGRIDVGGANTNVRAVRGTALMTASSNNFDGAYGVLGTMGHPTNGTVDLSSGGGNQNNKAIGVGGGISSRSSFLGTERDAIAAVFGSTGLHNSSGGSVTGGAMLYTGLFSGNGRTLGLWGENSSFIELLPRSQQLDYDAAVVGFYNSAANGGNNGASTGTADAYFSIETNVTDATAKDLVLQNRSTGDVGIKTSAPTANLSVNGTANKTGGGAWAVFSDARLKENVSTYNEGLDLITKVKPVSFSYNTKMDEIWGKSPSTEGKVYQGVIAQDLAKIAPDMVREVEVNLSLETESGLKGQEVETYLEVDPNKFTYALINSVKELKAEVDQLKAEVAALKAERLRASK